MYMGVAMLRVCWRVLAILVALLLIVPPAATRPQTIFAQSQPVDPKEIALTPADLPQGFTIAKETSEPLNPGPGVIYFIGMERPLTLEAMETGPVIVGQLIGRIDEPTSYAGFLDRRRQIAIEEDGYELVPGAPNDGGTASLQKFDGEVAAFEVGFIKRDMVIFTRWVGKRGVVSLQGVLTLAGVTSGRYDAVLQARAGSAPPAAGAAPRPAPEAAPTGPATGAGPTPERARIANTGGSGANVRSHPQVTGELLQVVHDGESVELIGAEETGADGRKWRNIRTASGTVGWVVGEYVAREGQPSAAVPPPPPPAPTPQPAPPRPTATPVPPTRQLGQIDSRLRPAVDRLFGLRKAPRGGEPWGDTFRSIAQISGVSMSVGPLPAGATAVFRARQNAIMVSSLVLVEDVRTVATVLAHELVHVGQTFVAGHPSLDCVAREVEAFQIEMLIWLAFYDGLAPGRTRHERTMNMMVSLWAEQGDPVLYKIVVDSPGYQDQCDLWVP